MFWIVIGLAVLLIILFGPWLITNFFFDQREKKLVKEMNRVEEEIQSLRSSQSFDHRSVEVLNELIRQLKIDHPDSTYIDDVRFIIAKVKLKETDSKGAAVWLEDMNKRMKEETPPLDTKAVEECIAKLKKVGV